MYEKDGFMNKSNIVELLANLDIVQENRVNTILNFLFENKDKIELKDFLQKLSLSEDGTRIKLEDYSLDESIILEMGKSQYIRESMRKSQLNQSRISIGSNISSKILGELEVMEGGQNSGRYGIDKIPKVLRNYFNYCSDLEEEFGYLAASFLSANEVFIDE